MRPIAIHSLCFDPSAQSGCASRAARSKIILLLPAWTMISALFCLSTSCGLAAEKPDPPPHPSVGQRFVPTDIDWQRPVYQTTFDDASVLREWRLEGGKRASIDHGKLVLESEPGEMDVFKH